MKTLLLFFISCWLTTSPLLAQESASFTVLFPKDGSQLSQDVQLRLLQFIDDVELRRVHHVSISGHTDADGSYAYNEALSRRRTSAVYDFILSRGIHERSVRFGSFGERMPVLANTNPENEQANRRVDIFIELIQFSTLEEFHDKLSSGVVSMHSIEAEETSIITGSMGTQVAIPPHAFTSNNGEPVLGQVNFILTEAMNNEQFAKEGLSMVSNGRILETGGMMKLEAFDEQENELSLKAGTTVNITIPSNERLDGMQTFLSSDGENWQEDEQAKNPLIKFPKRPYNQYGNYYDGSFKFKRDLANMPRKPIDPLFPRAPKEPDALAYQKPVKWFQFLKKKEIQELSNKTYLTAVDRFHKQSNKYERKVDLYELDCKSMSLDLEEYYLKKADWDNKQIQDSIAQRNAWIENSRLLNAKMRKVQGTKYDEQLAAWQQSCDSIRALNEQTLRNMRNADLQSTDYVLSASNLGWINCDRFVAAEEKFFVSITNPFKGDGKMLIVYDDIRSMISMPKFTFMGEEKYQYNGLPSGRKARLVAYTVEQGNLRMSVTPFSGPVEKLNGFEESSMGEFMDAISNQNITASQ